jgi:hypothetical protein
MTMDKEKFLSEDFFRLLQTIDPNALPLWGKMNLQQMVEHLSDSVAIANGKIKHETIITPEDRVPLLQGFLASDKEFRPETKNVMMGDEPLPMRNSSLAAAIAELQSEVTAFSNYFAANPGSRIRNPIFGDLDYTQWTQLLYKHFLHHLKQFGAAH